MTSLPPLPSMDDALLQQLEQAHQRWIALCEQWVAAEGIPAAEWAQERAWMQRRYEGTCRRRDAFCIQQTIARIARAEALKSELWCTRDVRETTPH